MTNGWKNRNKTGNSVRTESRRHSLASNGIKTGHYTNNFDPKLLKVKETINNKNKAKEEHLTKGQKDLLQYSIEMNEYFLEQENINKNSLKGKLTSVGLMIDELGDEIADEKEAPNKKINQTKRNKLLDLYKKLLKQKQN